MVRFLRADLLPQGVVTSHYDTKIFGVSNKMIVTVGAADVWIQLGSTIFRQKFIIVPKENMVWPQDSGIILGADFMAPNAIGIDSARWCMTLADRLLCNLTPAEIDGRQYWPVEASPPPEPVTVHQEDDAILSPQDDGRHVQDCSQDFTPSAPVMDSQFHHSHDDDFGATHDSVSASGYQNSVEACRDSVPPTPVLDSRETLHRDTPGTHRVVPASRDGAADSRPSAGDDGQHIALEDLGSTFYDVLPAAYYSCATGLTQIKARLSNPASPDPIVKDTRNIYFVQTT